MEKFLASTASSLAETTTTYPGSSYLVKVLVLLIISYECNMLSAFCVNKANHTTIGTLLQNLAIKDKQFISSNLLIHYQKPIGEILNILIGKVTYFSPSMTEWIFAVPLLHFVTRKCVPFQQLQKMKWGHNYMKG